MNIGSMDRPRCGSDNNAVREVKEVEEVRSKRASGFGMKGFMGPWVQGCKPLRSWDSEDVLCVECYVEEKEGLQDSESIQI